MSLFTRELHWVCDIAPHRIAVSCCPDGDHRLPAQVRAWKAEGVDVVVSLLEAHEQTLYGVEAEARLCASSDLTFRAFPITDHDVPESADAFAAFVREIHREVVEGRTVLVHCMAGIGRTGLLTSGVLFLLGVPRASIAGILQRSRGFAMPETTAQRRWLDAFYDVLAASH
jgi:protein-tyrosine phosphatase